MMKRCCKNSSDLGIIDEALEEWQQSNWLQYLVLFSLLNFLGGIWLFVRH